MQARGPEFDPQHPSRKPGIVMHVCGPSVKDVETGGSLGPAG